MSLYQPTIVGSTAVSQYCSLFDSNQNPILLLDSIGEMVYCNQSFISQFGETKEDLLEFNDVSKVWDQYTTSIFDGEKEGVLYDEVTSMEFRRLVLNDEVFCMVSLPTHAKLTLLTSGTKTNQISRMASADQELINSVLDNAPDAMLVLDYDNQVYVAANDRAEQLLGYSVEEILDLKLGELSPGLMKSGEIGAEVATKYLDSCIKSGKRVIFEWQVRHKNGTLIPCEISVFKLPTQNGTYVRTSILDISFREDLEKRIQQTRKEYEENVDEAIKSQREDQLRAFVRDSPIPVAMLDSNMNYLFVARDWVETFPTEFGEDIIGRNHYELNPHIPMRWKLVHKAALKGNAQGMKRDKYKDRDGKDAWCQWDVRPWYLDGKHIGGIIIYAQNITEDVEAENKMLEQERKFKHFFNSDSIGWIEIKAPQLLDVIRQDPDLDFRKIAEFHKSQLGTVLRYNRKIADIFGLPIDQVPEEFEPIRYVVEGREELAGKLFAAVRDNIESFDGEIVIENKYGELRNLNVNVHFTLAGGSGEILYGVQDVTDLKESVKALRESEERYRTMFDSNSLGVIYTNYGQGMVKINESFTEIFGYTEGDMQTLDENDMLLPEYHDLNRQITEDFRTGVKRYISVEKEYKRKDGRKIIAQTSSSALYDDSGLHYGNVTIIEDITERKTAELKIRKQNEELKKINQELDQFVYSAAHDLRAPIANVMGLVKLIRIEEISETAQHYLALQEKSLAKLDEFIKSIVDYSRNSRLDIAKDEINLDEFVNEVVDQYRFSENAEKLKIDIQVDQKGKFISDNNRLSVVMNNLVSNAVRYMDVEKDDCFLNIRVSSDKDMAKVQVEDNGIGIEQEHLESIFQLFYRASSNSKGTGIGLYIVKETVDKLKGKIDVSSEYGKGTTFTVTFKNFLGVKSKKK
ncbi:MAG: PAS domain S-box protein [Bacteroidia bacterium]|nr:PAS domain S-box protein [Bacteroidia bacterium]